MITNAEIARILREIAVFLDMDSVQFKPRAYEKAAYAIEALEEPVCDIYRRGGSKAICEIPGVGKSIAEKIVALVETGCLPYYDELHRKIPVDVAGLTSVEGVGPKMIKSLYLELGVKSVADLEKAARAGKLRGLPHFGEKSEQKILKSIGFLKKSTGRFLLGTVLPLAGEIEARLRQIRGVTNVAIAGSIRRRKETVGDGDLLVVASDADAVMDFVVSMPEVMSGILRCLGTRPVRRPMPRTPQHAEPLESRSGPPAACWRTTR